MDQDDIMAIFIKEGYCEKVYQLRLKNIGKASRGFEKTLQSILGQIARGRIPSPLQTDSVFQGIRQERDSKYFNWTSASLKANCPKSVELIEKWERN